MDTQNDGLEKVTPFNMWPFLVSMFKFWGIETRQNLQVSAPLFGMGETLSNLKSIWICYENAGKKQKYHPKWWFDGDLPGYNP